MPYRSKNREEIDTSSDEYQTSDEDSDTEMEEQAKTLLRPGLSTQKAAPQEDTALAKSGNAPSSKDAAKNAPAQTRSKRKAREDVSDYDEEELRRLKRRKAYRRQDSSRSKSKTAMASTVKSFCANSEFVEYSDIMEGEPSNANPTPLFLTRKKLTELSQMPTFRYVQGLFFRVRDTDTGGYTLCRIHHVQLGEEYNLVDSKLKTKFYLVLLLRGEEKQLQINCVSDKKPSSSEFESYKRRTLDSRQDLPRRAEIEELLKKAKVVFRRRSVTEYLKAGRSLISDYERKNPAFVVWIHKQVQARWDLQASVENLMSAKKSMESKNELELFFLEEEVEIAKSKLQEVNYFADKHGFKPVEDSMAILEAARERFREEETKQAEIEERAQQLEGRDRRNAFTRIATHQEVYVTINHVKRSKKESRP